MVEIDNTVREGALVRPMAKEACKVIDYRKMAIER